MCPLGRAKKEGVRRMKLVHIIAVALVLIGAFNWGLVALFDFNLVSMLLGSWPMVEKVAYILVGVSAVYLAFTHMSYCKICSKKK